MGRKGILRGGRVRALAAVAALLALVLAWPAGAQVVCTGGGCGGGAVTSPVATDPLSLTGAVTFDNAANTPLVCSDGLQDSTLTAGRVTFAGASGRLSDDANLTFVTDVLTAPKAVGSTSVSAGGAVDAAGAVTITANTITAEGATANASETAIAFGDATADGTVTVTGTTTGLNLQVTAPANTELRVTQTLPTSPSAQANAFKVDATGAGSAAFAQTAILGSLSSGYTGSALTYGVGGANATANTSTNPETGGTIGVLGYTSAGTTNIGGWFKAEGSGAVSNVGVFGFAKNSTTRQIGGWFTTGTGATANTALFVQYNYGGALPTLTNSAAIIDNTASAVDILTLRDNGTAVYAVQDGGSVYRLMGTKTLTEATDTSFVRVAVASGSRTGGEVFYCLNAADASDHQERCGSVPFAVVNKAGTETCAMGTASDVVAVSAGTLTVTWATDTATPTNGCDLRANATSSLTQTTLNLSYTVTLTGAAASAVTPQ